MFTTVKSYALDGIEGYAVEVEVFSQNGLPSLDIVGLATNAVKESKERVRSAITNSGFDFGAHKTVINLAPAEVKKDSSGLDLAIAVGYLAAVGQIPYSDCKNYVFLGELVVVSIVGYIFFIILIKKDKKFLTRINASCNLKVKW